MGFRLEFENSAKKSLNHLDFSVYSRIKKKIEEIQINPFLFGSIKLVGNFFGENCYRIRVGDYRIIYEVYTKENSILILKIERRSKVYRVKEEKPIYY